ncbi:MAG: IS607 family transposase [Anaerolineae bacterium]|nr:IS607 family transposase [Anaerolineae bacterium]
MRYVKLREACERSGLHPHTIRKYADTGAIPSVRTPGGQRLFAIDAFLGQQLKTGIVLYARVSSYRQKDDLARQIEYLTSHYPGCEVISDIAGGLNFKRKGLRAILERSLSGDQLTLVVAHRDRLARFGFELIEWLIERNGGKVVVLSKSHLAGPAGELTADLLSILDIFAARMHGLRKYRDQIAQDPHLSDSPPGGDL